MRCEQTRRKSCSTRCCLMLSQSRSPPAAHTRSRISSKMAVRRRSARRDAASTCFQPPRRGILLAVGGPLAESVSAFAAESSGGIHEPRQYSHTLSRPSPLFPPTVRRRAPPPRDVQFQQPPPPAPVCCRPSRVGDLVRRPCVPPAVAIGSAEDSE